MVVKAQAAAEAMPVLINFGAVRASVALHAKRNENSIDCSLCSSLSLALLTGRVKI